MKRVRTITTQRKKLRHLIRRKRLGRGKRKMKKLKTELVILALKMHSTSLNKILTL